MQYSYPIFDRSQLRLRSLSERVHDMTLETIMDLQGVNKIISPFPDIGKAIRFAKSNGSAIIMIMGAHVIRSGVQRFIIDLMEKGFISCMAFNGAGIIHDFELALIGATTENVRHYIEDGKFGLWKETGVLNDIITQAAADNQGAANSVGAYIEEQNLPGKQLSLLANAHRLGILTTCHVSIGQDIIHEHPNFDGAAWGASSLIDFLYFAAQVQHLEGGVLMNLGSAVMGPEIFLKALAMARNVAMQNGRQIASFSTLVTDLAQLPINHSSEASKNEHLYYFRPWKTLLSRTITEEGKSFYVQLPHKLSVPQIWTATVENNSI